MESTEKCIPVRVAVRCRPLVPKEVLEGCEVCIRFVGGQQQVVLADKAFTYDLVFPPEREQREVYEGAVSKLIAEIFKGYNVTVLAYGQTGSGKTFTMGTCCGSSWQGIDSDAGIIPRAVHDIFVGIEERTDKEFTVKASFLEIYKEDILDLFSKGQDREPLSVREDNTGSIKIVNLSEVAVRTPEETLRLLESGSAARRTAATGMNARSSRSHAIFTLSVEQRTPGDVNDSTMAKFHLVDLAGSERAAKTKAQGERLKEGININKGLLSLGNVISALCDESSHVPYRDSKLTRLLQDSLGGNSHTIMIACISPADSNFDETLNTLRYADRARKIKNKPVVNRDPQAMELMHLRQLVQQLQSRVQQLQHPGERKGGEELSCITAEEGEEARDLLNRTECLVEDNRTLQEHIQQLQDDNRKLSAELHSALDQLSTQGERLIMAQMELERMHQLNEELTSKFLQPTTDDKKAAEILKDIQSSIHEYMEDKKKLKETSDSLFKMNGEVTIPEGEEGNEALDEDTTTGAVELSRTFRRAAMTRELEELNKVLLAKEELASKMNVNDTQLEIVRQQYESTMQELEREISNLRKERDELSQALVTVKSSTAPKGLSEQRRRRIQELEERISQLKKKVSEQSHIVKMKEESERNARKLQEEILAMKQARVRLMKQLKEESERHRQEQLRRDREVRALRIKDQRQVAALAKLERQSALRMGVMQRRMDEALAAKQRLEVALAQRRDARKHPKGGLEGMNSRIRNWLAEEVAILTDSSKVQHHLQSLLESRRAVAEELNEVKMALEKNPSEGDAKSLQSKQKELEGDIKELTVQIGELQQKILDIDPEKRSRSMFSSLNDTAEAQTIAGCLLKMVTEKELESYVSKMRHDEIKREADDLRARLEDMEKKIQTMEKGFEMRMVDVEREHQEKTLFLMRHSTSIAVSSHPDADASVMELVKMQEGEISRLQYLREELERKTEEVDQLKREMARMELKSSGRWLEDLSAKKHKKPVKPKAASRFKTVDNLEDIFDVSYECSNDENDPDWSLETEYKGPVKRKSQEEEKAKPMKRSSSATQLACKCRGDCKRGRCGCSKNGRTCTASCRCKGKCADGSSTMCDRPLEEEPLITKFCENVQDVLQTTFNLPGPNF